MIPALGAGGPGFESRFRPMELLFNPSSIDWHECTPRRWAEGIDLQTCGSPATW